eukprot:7041407-Ditylum_brightwellii.AAC.1
MAPANIPVGACISALYASITNRCFKAAVALVHPGCTELILGGEMTALVNSLIALATLSAGGTVGTFAPWCLSLM